MQLKDDSTIAAIRETRHKVSEEFGHDPQRIIAYYIELQRKEEERRQLNQSEAEQLLEPAKAA